jgi:hypothetical protein
MVRAPRTLFDVEGGAHPPRDAVELYVPTPATVGILYSSTDANGDRDMAEAILEFCIHALDRALPYLQREAGYVKAGQHFPGPGGSSIGSYLSAQLETTTVAELYTADHTDVARIHQHVYLGATARCDDDGQYWPVHLDGVRTVLPGLYAVYQSELTALFRQGLEVEWSECDDGTRQITTPPVHELVGRHPRSVPCPGPFRVAHRWDVAAESTARRV